MVRQLGSKLRDIDPFAFETFVAQMYIIDGYATKVTDKTGDGKKDVLAVDLEDDGTEIIECKRYGPNSSIDRRSLSKICEEIHKFVDNNGITDYEITIITTSRNRFSSTNRVVNNRNINYIGGDALIDKLKSLNAEYLVDCYASLDKRLETFHSIKERFNYMNISVEDELMREIQTNPNRLEIITYIECMRQDIKLEHLNDVEKVLKDYDSTYE